MVKNKKKIKFLLFFPNSSYYSFYRIHCFDGVAAVLFVAALSGYDCCLVEDKYSVSVVHLCLTIDYSLEQVSLV